MSFTKHLNGLSEDLLKAAQDLLEGKKEEKDEIEFEIPEEVAKEDVGDFVVAASAAKKAGKKEFEFGGKKFPVTIKKAVNTEEVAEEFKTCSGCKTEEKCMAESKCLGEKYESKDKEDGKKKNEIEVNPELEEEVQLDELTKKEIAQAIEIAMDNGGAMTKAVKMIEKIKKGLSKHKEVQAALRVANEDFVKEENLEEAPSEKKLIDYLVKKGSNPKDAEKMVKKHFKYASDKYSKASTAKMAEVIMSLDEEALSHEMKKAWQKVGSELKKYGATKGGIDKKAFQDIGHMFDFTTRVDDAKKGHSSTEILNRVMQMDTDVRDKMMDIITKGLGTKWKNSRPTAKEIFGKYLSEETDLEERWEVPAGKHAIGSLSYDDKEIVNVSKKQAAALQKWFKTQKDKKAQSKAWRELFQGQDQKVENQKDFDAYVKKLVGEEIEEATVDTADIEKKKNISKKDMKTLAKLAAMMAAERKKKKG